MAARYAELGIEFTESRKRMARTPEGAELIENKVSGAPGIRMENVYTMAGVPKIMQAMMDAIAPTLKGRYKNPVANRGLRIRRRRHRRTAWRGYRRRHPSTMIGSYPRFEDGNYSTQIVVRGRDGSLVSAAVEDVENMLAELRG